jgi:serine/threonine-protein kinase
MGAGESQLVAEEVDEQHPGLDVTPMLRAVYGNSDLSHLNPVMRDRGIAGRARPASVSEHAVNALVRQASNWRLGKSGRILACHLCHRPHILQAPGSPIRRQAAATGTALDVEDLASHLEESLAGAYHIVREIGGGGMSRVFQAEESAFGRSVVIKVLPPELAAGVSIERFQRETQVAAQLRHPNIVPVFTAGKTGGLLFFTMPFIEGESLRDRMRRETRLPLRTAVMIARDVADALEYAHRRGILHRDIKPENILLEGSHAVVADFGIARAVHSAVGTSTLTQAGMSLGTPHYMSPEQASGERDQDPRADIYSLGCVFYEMLAGVPPFTGRTPVAVIVKHIGTPVPSLADAGVTLPPEVDALIACALAKAADDRFATSADFAAALAALIGLDDLSYRTPKTGGHNVLNRSDARIPTISRMTAAASSTIDSVGVMPFVNGSNDAEAEYLTEGIGDNITNRLTRMPGVRVIPRSTMMMYKGETDLAAVARALKVRALVTGRLHRVGQTLIIKSELVDMQSDRQLWGEEYRRTMSDILAIQDEMATEISDSLRLKLTAEDRETLLRRYTDNPAAYQSYLRGRFHWNKRNQDGFLQAIVHFQAAIDCDSGYALAYAGLSDTYNVLGYYNLRPPTEVYPLATEAAMRALEIDPGLPQAHASLGYTRLFFDRDWASAEQAFRRAIELDPQYPSAHQWYGWYLMVKERYPEMIAEMEIAHTLDPLALIITNHLGYAYLLDGHDDFALKQFEHARELDPAYSLTYWHLGGYFLRTARYDEAVTAFRSARERTDGRLFLGYEALALALGGCADEARAAVQRLEARRTGAYASPLELALAWAGLGELDTTFKWLDLAVVERSSDLVRLKVLPWPSAVRSDQRFAALVKRVGLPA